MLRHACRQQNPEQRKYLGDADVHKRPRAARVPVHYGGKEADRGRRDEHGQSQSRPATRERSARNSHYTGFGLSHRVSVNSSGPSLQGGCAIRDGN